VPSIKNTKVANTLGCMARSTYPAMQLASHTCNQDRISRDL